ncbi:hypothetical protein [Desulfofundulus thermosubterraneus]|uniref:Uncharacterized protein n=1 Tax=Desulfofundulus thermosubterraneus DSM 16057 TaxID=1121432 RepID=A0A1M6ETD4_9FIRM|nr:hypothetical protein [Desulfofundulus thermosubterraneus]SHI88737.1 hypothetical protein SAMN02745219_01272 [Desulfofundulus thermosubterraneus DSM 16057]
MKGESGKRSFNYAKGLALGAAQCKRGDGESIDFTGRAFDLLACLTEAQALTTSAAASALSCHRKVAGSAFTSLWWAGMVCWVGVFAEMGQHKGQFRLWYPADGRPPKNAQEACRLAALGLFYALAKNEVPGFKWQVLRNGKGGVTAEMQLVTRAGIAEKWVIDAPRRGEDAFPHADVYIFPTLQEGEDLTPPGKRYTADELLLIPGELREKIFLKST